MSITLDLSPQDEARLAAAAEAEGVDRAAVLRRVVRAHLLRPKAVNGATPDAENQRAIDLLRAWREEDATEDEEDLERRDVANAELMRNLETSGWRAFVGVDTDNPQFEEAVRLGREWRFADSPKDALASSENVPLSGE